jgi:hypothetical protein
MVLACRLVVAAWRPTGVAIGRPPPKADGRTRVKKPAGGGCECGVFVIKLLQDVTFPARHGGGPRASSDAAPMSESAATGRAGGMRKAP